MLIKVNGTDIVYPYALADLRVDNPNVSFPKNPSVELLSDFSVYEVVPTPQPDYDWVAYNLVEKSPEPMANPLTNIPTYQQAWELVACTPEEIQENTAKYNLEQDKLSQRAYRDESDPIFFKWQRGEATEQEWLDKVAEIKALYPDY